MSWSVQVTAIHVLSGLLETLQSAGILSLFVTQMQQEFAAPTTADEVRSVYCFVLLKQQYMLCALLKACGRHLTCSWLQVVDAWAHSLQDLQRQDKFGCADLLDLLHRLSATMAAPEADVAVCPVVKHASTSSSLACPYRAGSVHH